MTDKDTRTPNDCRDSFIDAGYWPNEVMWKAWEKAWTLGRASAERETVELRQQLTTGLAEEAPESYKDVDEGVRVSHEIGIGNLDVRVKPLIVIKG